MTAAYIFDHVLGPDGWLAPGRIEVDEDGDIAAVGAAGAGGRPVRGIALPGLANLHSHAFQRAMAGLAERAGTADDSFWTWRETMYGFVERIGPDDVEAIAAQLYVEMLKAGYTAVGEFHYLHHDRDGRAFAEPAEMSARLLAAARQVGIAITLLPVLYESGGFGGAPVEPRQRRFANEPAALLRIVEAARAAAAGDREAVVGIAPHSLRAVSPAALAEALDGMAAIDPGAPVHIHIAEQAREVEACLAWSGIRPLTWLLDTHEVGPAWCLVHATHMSEGETRALAASGAVAGLCPTTEANLGDGLFPLGPYLEAGGRLGVGSDSHVSVSPVEELRWLEYGQRLATGRRAVAARPGGSTGARLFGAAASGGAQALGREAGALAPGRRADLVVLDADHPLLAGKAGDDLLDAWIFAGNANLVRDVMVAGRWVVRGGRHGAEDEAERAFRASLARLAAA